MSYLTVRKWKTGFTPLNNYLITACICVKAHLRINERKGNVGEERDGKSQLEEVHVVVEAEGSRKSSRPSSTT